MLPTPDINGLVPSQQPLHELSEESDNSEYDFGDIADTNLASELTPSLFDPPTLNDAIHPMNSMAGTFPQSEPFEQTAAFSEVVGELVSPGVRGERPSLCLITYFDIVSSLCYPRFYGPV
ncbi:hypothetical protein BN14_06508 [Rhizoctonia solani AG-1 IB]|uniref:Uncharacterized protein n=1 Tax=Thanatephorus cucumeris (strain AG1-IB / isolate 7/3/14) TaxID=1108050 RepID=M5BXT5_THACB|nr:hypothetical protein BN14_06508 [Rhizoctonia solani AG-1 IB]